MGIPSRPIKKCQPSVPPTPTMPEQKKKKKNAFSFIRMATAMVGGTVVLSIRKIIGFSYSDYSISKHNQIVTIQELN